MTKNEKKKNINNIIDMINILIFLINKILRLKIYFYSYK